MRVHVLQLAYGDDEPLAARVSRVADLVRAQAGADLVVLPELWPNGGFAYDTWDADAQALDGHVVTALRAATADLGAVVHMGSFVERDEAGRLFNTSVLLGPDGTLRAVYRKLHLWDGEKLLFAPGADAPPVVDTRVGRVAVVICYDLEFPELTRAVALAGAQLLAVPTNWPLVPRPDGERPPEALIAMAAARVNRMAVACADRLGTERGQEWTGGATIVGVDGWVAAETREPGLLIADLDLAPALDKRLTDRADAFGDRRPELYASVVA